MDAGAFHKLCDVSNILLPTCGKHVAIVLVQYRGWLLRWSKPCDDLILFGRKIQEFAGDFEVRRRLVLLKGLHDLVAAAAEMFQVNARHLERAVKGQSERKDAIL